MPARQTPRAQDGFILIEVLVSALILAIVAGAVLTLITATTRSAASERNHSAAYALAQEDQARMRTMRISSLNKLSQTRNETVGGTTFTIESKGVFVDNKSGTPSCSESNDSADYVEITSNVSSPTLLHPVSIESVVSPSSGSLDPSHGTLSIQADNAAGEPLSGVSIVGSGLRSFSGSTESIGCANFADLPSGNYKVTTSANNLITPEGKTSETKEQIGVPASGTQLIVIHYDKAGQIEPSFVYREGSTATMRAAPVDSMEVYNSESGTSAMTWGAPGGSRASTLNDPSLYPFKTKYTVYAGSCEGNNPAPNGESAKLAGLAYVEVKPGSTSTPQIQVPALNLTVTYNSGLVSGARVKLTDTKCQSGVKRTFTTNSEGHPASTTTGATEAGLPWGTYKVCASAKIGNEYRRAEANAVVESLANWTTLNLSLSGSGSTGSSSESNQC
ncbi:MAG TPA: prepilin-type N-terminal cleavage/methylation domain-containing protein [Solirubrobacterales bacterium]|nr:prepilin-type N-terminal cleavage/methylation domain-containing protein [Solirubrobacterales bacterium]